MFPDIPYTGYSWRLTHHMGRVTPDHLYHILWAANAFSQHADSAADINNYLIANSQWTANIREDSGQPDAWRDYQQILSELGLMYSLEVVPQITPTPLGLALLDGSMGFSEVMTLQALRFQYPNGHHVAVGNAQRKELTSTAYASVETLTELQELTGVQIRPAVLVWKILRRLSEQGSPSQLSVDEIERYLMRCSTVDDHIACADAIVSARAGGINLLPMGSRQRRNAQDWMKFLMFTSIFSVTDAGQPILTISSFGNDHALGIDEICFALETSTSFWRTSHITREERLHWYSMFGGIDLSIPELPQVDISEGQQEFVGGEEGNDEPEVSQKGATPGNIELREYKGIQLPISRSDNLTIQSVYRSELSITSHRLHDQMVLLIAETCQIRGAVIFEDPKSVDLLVQYQQREFIIEVKSVTPRNFIARLRCAIGQILHYDFLRAPQTQLARRKVIAFAAQIPSNSWSINFINNYLDMDLLTLESGKLRIHSLSQASVALFGDRLSYD